MGPNPRTVWTMAAAALLLGACGKATEKAAEKAAEKMIEAQASKDGTKAKVDLQDGKTRVTTTDAEGKTSHIEVGGAKVSEADLGVPIYPGAKQQEGSASRADTPEGKMVMVVLTTGDAPDKVAAYYREQLKSRAAGKQFMDMNSGDGQTTLILGDDQANSSLHIQVTKGEPGTAIHIMANQGKKSP